MDLAVEEDVEEDAVATVMAKEEVICWMRTSAWREMLNVDVWVMRKRVSMCLLILANDLS